MRQLDDNRAVAAGRGFATGRTPTGPVVEVGGLNVAYAGVILTIQFSLPPDAP